jgi:UDP-glucose 4-epimerase
MSGSHLLITGAGGYLGGIVAATAASPGLDVVTLVRHDAPWLSRPGVSVVRIPALDERVLSHFGGADSVVHLAGANETVFRDHPDAAFDSTVTASRAVAEICAQAQVKRLVFVSTVHVYGSALQPGAVVTENTPPEPAAPYALARLESEHAILEAAGSTEVVILRLTNGVGAPAAPEVNRWTLVANDLCRQAVSGGQLRLLSSGRQWRDFVALRDVARIVIAASRPDELPAGLYNLSAGQSITVLELAHLVAQRAAVLGFGPKEVVTTEDGALQTEPYVVEAKRLGSHGLAAELPLVEAVDETIRFCHANVLQW